MVYSVVVVVVWLLEAWEMDGGVVEEDGLREGEEKVTREWQKASTFWNEWLATGSGKMRARSWARERMRLKRKFGRREKRPKETMARTKGVADMDLRSHLLSLPPPSLSEAVGSSGQSSPNAA